MRMECSPNVQAISEESIICIAVKEDRHQNIMSSVALKQGVEEPWTVERVAKFIDLLGYREITLTSCSRFCIAPKYNLDENDATWAKVFWSSEACSTWKST